MGRVFMTIPRLAGIHHVKIPVTELTRSIQWYESVFDLRVVMQFPDATGELRGVVGEIDGLGPAVLALRLNPAASAGIRGFDPIAFAVDGRDDILAWAAHLDALQIEHSPVFEASEGWMLVFADPDGLELHLYSWARHGVDHSTLEGYGFPVAETDAP